MYDATDRRSFESICNWISQIQQRADIHVNNILVGNSALLDEKNGHRGGSRLAKELGVDFFECSAKNDINIEQSFLGLARAMKDCLVQDGGGGPSNSGVKLMKRVCSNRRGNNCC